MPFQDSVMENSKSSSLSSNLWAKSPQNRTFGQSLSQRVDLYVRSSPFIMQRAVIWAVFWHSSYPFTVFLESLWPHWMVNNDLSPQLECPQRSITTEGLSIWRILPSHLTLSLLERAERFYDYKSLYSGQRLEWMDYLKMQ